MFDSIDLALFGQNCNFHLHTTKRKLNKNRKTALKFSKKKRMRTRNVALMRGPCAGMFRGLLHIYLICILHAKIVYTSKATVLSHGGGNTLGAWHCFRGCITHTQRAPNCWLPTLHAAYTAAGQLGESMCVSVYIYICVCVCLCAFPSGCINCMFNWPTINDLMNTADTLKDFKHKKWRKNFSNHNNNND